MKCSWLSVLVYGFLAAGVMAQEHGPVFLMEPPARLTFSNGTGAKVSCAAHGFPPPKLSWLMADGSNVENVLGLRQVLENGTLILHPFTAVQYRQDVHGAVYRCRAHNTHGTIISRDMKAQAVVWQDWSVQVTVVRGEAGGPSLLSCGVPESIRGHSSVVAWHRDDSVIMPNHDDLMGRHVVSDEGWKLIVRDLTLEDSRAQFTCSVSDSLTGERKRSPPAHIDVASHTTAGAPRALLHSPWDINVKKGSDALLPCLVRSSPPATITWYREGAGGSLREVRPATELGGRLTAARDVLLIRRAEPADGGRWACRAVNPHGHLTLHLVVNVNAHLTVHVQPQLQMVNSGGTASINCSWGGWPTPRLEWLHNGISLGTTGGHRVKVGQNGALIVIDSVQRSDRGLYQCVARNGMDSAQASAEVRLGDTAPELQYTFIEQALRPGQMVALKCLATASPAPHFTWLLDGQPLNTIARGRRYSVEQFSSQGNEIVGFLNISAVRTEDGGLYTCKAANSLGEVAHSARLNIYGPPYVRSVGPIRAVAGRELVLYCPYSGYPISSVRWEREGGVLQPEGGATTEGALHIAKVTAGHGGAYICTVTGPRGEIARRDLQLVVSNPPEIEPFSFSANLQEGKRAQVSCSVTSGDMPVYFTWFKDGASIPSSLQVEERGAEFFSNLVFKEVTARHSGFYTCVASNSAAKVNYTTELVVKVSPKWVTEPSDASILVGESVFLHCQTTGSPAPVVTWSKQRGTEFLPLVTLGGKYQFLLNGTLWIQSAMAYDEGQYMCKAENGVGAALSKTVFVSINEPARFELTSHNMTARRDAPVTLTCDVMGDHPIQVQWTHNNDRLDLNTYRLIVSEAKTEVGLKSQLYISRTERHDSGVYKCQAVNAYGHSDHYIYLSVQEKPDAPHGLSVIEIASRGVKLAWAQGFDGHSPLVGYTVQHAPLSSQHSPHAHWDAALTINVTLDDASHLYSPVVVTKKGDDHYEAMVNELKPHTAYMIRVAAVNLIDRSTFTEPVVVKTQEEAPSEAPLQVQATPSGPGELHVSWRPPPRQSWNGEILGYTVICTEEGAVPTNTSRVLTVNGWSASEVSLTGLRKYTRYQVQVKAFNAIAAGPISVPVYATTLEGVPESHPTRVSCSPLSSVSVKVSWSPPPPGQHGGLIQGYKVVYTPLSGEQADMSEVKRVTSTDTYLHALHKYTNYSIQVLAFTNAGDGKRSPPVFCMTEEDVPSAPEKIKALAYSTESVLVSWLAPLHPNGIVLHYTVYHREAGRIGKHSSFVVSAEKQADMEMVFQVRNLLENQLYEFWVSAATSSGEGEATSVVGQGPSSRIPARISSFGGTVVKGAGQDAVLTCSCVGNPTPRSRWTHAQMPVTHHKHYQVTPRGHLHIKEVNEHSSGNFTCTATNTIGEDAITYHVVAILPPAPPALSLQYTTSSAIKVHWLMPKDGGAPISGYILHVKPEKELDWFIIEMSPEVNSHILEALRCGTKYQMRIQARNRLSVGLASEILTASTRGSVPKAPKIEDLINANSTAIKVNFYAWRDGGCPIASFAVSYRRAGTEHWIKAADSAGASSHVLSELVPAHWYELRVVATNDAGATELKIHVDTLKSNGGRIPPLEPSSPLSGEEASGFNTVILSCVASAVVIVTTVAAIICVLQGKRRTFCMSGGHYLRENRKLSESNEAEREKLRDGQKLYSSSSINNEKSNDDSSELYEISPYATFGIAEGAMGANSGAGTGALGAGLAAHSLHFRTFGRREDEAVPPRRHRREHRHSHGAHPHAHAHAHTPRSCDHYHYDESSLSKSSTVEARHRVRAAAAGWRPPPSDSDSDSAANTTTKGSGSPGGSAYGVGRRNTSSGGVAGSESMSIGFHSPAPAPPDISSLIDKYQQRKEQERRECTIHV